MPLGVGKQTVVFPGFDGGAEWGGRRSIRRPGFYYVNANDLAWTGGLAPSRGHERAALYLQHCATCHRDDRAGTPPQIPSLVGIGERSRCRDLGVIREGRGPHAWFPTCSRGGERDRPLPGDGADAASRRARQCDAAAPLVPYRFTGYRKFLDPDGYPAVAPPWGTLNAINLNTGDYAWQSAARRISRARGEGLKNTGSENYGGPIVTAGGLVFIGATNHDRKFRAFDKATGALLWETTLPFSGNATPATYEVDGRQFVVIAAGGGKGVGRRDAGSASGGAYVAFTLGR